jgi:hypothetical protein
MGRIEIDDAYESLEGYESALLADEAVQRQVVPSSLYLKTLPLGSDHFHHDVFISRPKAL